MLGMCCGAAEVRRQANRADDLEQQLTSALLQQRWKQAQLAAAIEARQNTAADMLQTVQRLKDVAVGMRDKSGNKDRELAVLERDVMEQAVRMQSEKEQALDSARTRTLPTLVRSSKGCAKWPIRF